MASRLTKYQISYATGYFASKLREMGKGLIPEQVKVFEKYLSREITRRYLPSVTIAGRAVGVLWDAMMEAKVDPGTLDKLHAEVHFEPEGWVGFWEKGKSWEYVPLTFADGTPYAPVRPLPSHVAAATYVLGNRIRMGTTSYVTAPKPSEGKIKEFEKRLGEMICEGKHSFLYIRTTPFRDNVICRAMEAVKLDAAQMPTIYTSIVFNPEGTVDVWKNNGPWRRVPVS